MIKMAIVIGLFYGGYLGFRSSRATATPIEKPVATIAPVTPLKNSGVIDQALTASIKVSVNSSPTGAQIYLDGKDTSYYTPAVISVTANQQVKFVLKKESFLEYEISQKFDRTTSLEATLQPTARAGYLNIYLSNGGEATKIYVNGKELTEKTPVMKYPILADTVAVIRAFNPITELSDEVTLKLAPGENKNIELILGRSKDKLKK